MRAIAAPSPDIILCSMGTLGDVKPFLAIGRSLAARGFRVTLLTNECWRKAALAAGLAMVPIAPRDPPQSGRDDRAFFHALVRPSFDVSFNYIRDQALQGCRPIVVHRTGMLGAAVAAERFDLPSIRIALQPCAVRSFERPAWPFTPLAEGRFSWVRKQLLVPAAFALSDRMSPFRSSVSAFRKAAGLQPKADPRHQVEQLLLMLCPRWFAQPQGDWPERLACTGFPYEPSSRVPTPSQDGATAPILFTSGTGVVDDAHFVARCRAVAAANRRPALILSRTAPAGPHSQDCKVLRFVDLAMVLPACAAIVHHGGIGTTAEAIRAGLPQLIVADRFDQPDNGVRVAELALGGAILSDAPSAELISATLSRILASGHVRAQVQTAATLVRNDDAVGCVVDHVEAIAGGRAMPQLPRVAA